jgi:hypothetical protein
MAVKRNAILVFVPIVSPRFPQKKALTFYRRRALLTQTYFSQIGAFFSSVARPSLSGPEALRHWITPALPLSEKSFPFPNIYFLLRKTTLPV